MKKWKPLILWELPGRPKEFDALHRSLPGVSQKMLTQRLKELQRHGVVPAQRISRGVRQESSIR